MQRTQHTQRNRLRCVRKLKPQKTQGIALRALRKRKPQATQAFDWLLQ